MDEPTQSTIRSQIIRPIDQVVGRPRHATCLDLCVAFSGACLDAGLHATIVILESASGGSAHSVVVVWLDRAWTARPSNGPWSGVVHDRMPVTVDGTRLIDDIRISPRSDGAFLVVDVSGAGLHGIQTQSQKTWEAAVADGAALLLSKDWDWGLGIDIGMARWEGHQSLKSPDWPHSNEAVITPAYVDVPSNSGPMAHIQARSGTVPFVGRDELHSLTDWALDDEETSTLRLSLVFGSGGVGKTRLAAELCKTLEAQGWFVGFLQRDPVPTDRDVAWLATIVSPVLLVVDYAEDVPKTALVELIRALRATESRVCILLTARTTGTWWHQLIAAVGRNGLSSAVPLLLELRSGEPWGASLFRRAAETFALLPGMAKASGKTPSTTTHWTALELIAQAWLDVSGAHADPLPSEREGLFDQILEREFDYWRRSLINRGLPAYDSHLLAQLGTTISLLKPVSRDRIVRAIACIPEFEASTPERSILVASLSELLAPTGGEQGLSIRPDPIAEHLVLRELSLDLERWKVSGSPGLFRAVPGDGDVLTSLPPDEATVLNPQRYSETVLELHNLCEVITKLRSVPTSRAVELAAAVITIGGMVLIDVATTKALESGGPFSRALEVAGQEPFGEIPDHVSYGHSTLRTLAMLATQKFQPVPQLEDDNEAIEFVSARLDLAVRLLDAGKRHHATMAAKDAITILDDLGALQTKYRAHAYTITAATLIAVGQVESAKQAIAVATSIHTQASERDSSDTGDGLYWDVLTVAELSSGNYEAALAASDKALEVHAVRDFPVAYRTLRGGSLQYRAAVLSRIGKHEQALEAARDSVEHRRPLVEALPGAFLPDLADSLEALSVALIKLGLLNEASVSAEESLAIREQLSETQIEVFGADLAGSLLVAGVADFKLDKKTRARERADAALGIYQKLALVYPDEFQKEEQRARDICNLMLDDALNIEDFLAIPKRLATAVRFGGAIPMSQMDVANLHKQEGYRPVDETPEFTIRGLLSHNPVRPGLPDRASLERETTDVVAAEEVTALAEIRLEAEDLPGAIEAYRLAIHILENAANSNATIVRSAHMTALIGLSHALQLRGLEVESLSTLTTAMDIERTLRRTDFQRDPHAVARTLFTLGKRLAAAGETERSLAIAQDAVSLLRGCREHMSDLVLSDLAMALYVEASCLFVADAVPEAVVSLTEAVELLRDLPGHHPKKVLVPALEHLASWLKILGRNVGAIQALTEALDVVEASDNPDLEVVCRLRIKLVVQHLACNQYPEATRAAEKAVIEARGAVADQSQPRSFLLSIVVELTQILRPAEAEIDIDHLYSLAASGFSSGLSSQIWSGKVISGLEYLKASKESGKLGERELATAIADTLGTLQRPIRHAEEQDAPELIGEARRTIRDLYQDLQAIGPVENTELPRWVTLELPARWTQIMSEWIGAPDITAQKMWMDRNHVDILSRTFIERTRVLAYVWPEIIPISSLLEILEDTRRAIGEPPIDELERLIEENPKDAASLGAYALLLHTSNSDPARVEAAYMRAIEVAPKDPVALGNYALFLHMVRQDMVNARKYYLRAVNEAPQEGHLIRNFAYFLQSLGTESGLAQETYEQALLADPKDVETLGAYAHFLSNVVGDVGKADLMYSTAVALEPENPRLLYHYGLFLRDVKNDAAGAQKALAESRKNAASNKKRTLGDGR